MVRLRLRRRSGGERERGGERKGRERGGEREGGRREGEREREREREKRQRLHRRLGSDRNGGGMRLARTDWDDSVHKEDQPFFQLTTPVANEK